MDPDRMDCAHLVSACARDTGNVATWNELLMRYGSKIKTFIRRACHLWLPEMSSTSVALPGAIQQCDLFQIAIVRLVENGCAVMKAFCGTTEDEWLAYLAAIASSVVCDTIRSQSRLKRRGRAGPVAIFPECPLAAPAAEPHPFHPEIERGILAREVRTLCERVLRNPAGKHSARDRLIFRLYFLHDLSIRQIAECRVVNLSRSGVKKVLHGLGHRVQNMVTGGAPEKMRQHRILSSCPACSNRR